MREFKHAHIDLTGGKHLDPQHLPVPSRSLMNVVLIGSGLSKAAQPESPTWAGLLEKLRRTLRPKDREKPTSDYFAEALRLSRRYSRRRDARPTVFQQAVVAALQPHWKKKGRLFKGYAATIADFLRTVEADVIVDLNYDPLIEWVLQEAQIRYIKATGSEVHWTGPLPSGAKLLWKLHGDLSAPSTIVLSPTEYQRMYEVNALGVELDKLGQRAGVIWSVGVGLTDDDVWSYLCGGTCASAVRAILLTGKPKRGTEEELTQQREWFKIVTSPNDIDVRILHDHYQSRSLQQMLIDVTTAVASNTHGPPSTKPTRTQSGLSRYLTNRSNEFDDLYEKLRGAGDGVSIASQFRKEFEAIRESLLCASAGVRAHGHRWLPAIGSRSVSGIARLSTSERKNLDDDGAAVIKYALELCARYVDTDAHRGLLVACAAQAALGYIFELSEMFDLGWNVELGAAPSNHFLQRDTRVLVGSNPFFMRGPRSENAMHFYKTDRAIKIGPPILGWFPSVAAAKINPDDTKAPPRLLKEDEWEAAVLHVYRKRGPTAVVGKHRVDGIEAIPPLYPWGFRLLDVGTFRAQSMTAVSVCWQLVEGFLGENQVCKGGALRDRGRRAFRVGGRGQLRIGEYDDFVAPAYHYESSSAK